MMRSNESASSVFYHSQEEDAGKVSDSQGSHRENQVASLFDSCQDTTSESSPVATEHDAMGTILRSTGYNCSILTNVITSFFLQETTRPPHREDVHTAPIRS